MNRRTLLAAVGLGTAGLAGCLGSDDDDDDGNGGDGNGGDGDDSTASIATGFDACTAPDTDDLRSMLPTEADVGDLSEAGSGEMSMGSTELESITFREGGSTDVKAVAARFGQAPESEDDLEMALENAETPHAEALAYVTVEEYGFIAGGFDEEHAIDILAAFQVLDRDCAESAVVIDSE